MKKVKKNSLIIGIIIIELLFILLCFNVYKNKHKYKITNEVRFKEQKVDHNTFAVLIEEDGNYVEYNNSTWPDSNNYVLNSDKSGCLNLDGELIPNALSFNNSIVSLRTNETVKCYLYFDEFKCNDGYDYTACKYITSNKNFEKLELPLTDVEAANHDDTLYTAEDDWGTSYIFRGNITNNWMVFGKEGDNYIWWRIIRINGDNTIRMIYAGTSASDEVAPSTTGMGTAINNGSTYCFATENCDYDDNAYVGYMYGTPGSSTYENTHTNTNSSYVKQIIDTWYEANLKDDYGSYLSGSTGFCGDRSLYSGKGYKSSETTFYYGRRRLYNTNTPNLICVNSNDLYTSSDPNVGNKALINSVGMLTLDEAMLVGGMNGTTNHSYYLYTSNTYWLISPSHFYESGAFTACVDSSGYVYGGSVYGARGLRPVINLKANTQLIGSGTSTNPYKVIYDN